MNKNYSCKYFEFTKSYFLSPEKIGHYDLYQIGELEMSENAYIPEHRQVCFEISYIFSGEGVFRTANTDIPVRAGDIHIISTNTLHEIRSAKNKGIRFAYLGFSFNDRFPQDTLGHIPKLFLTNPARAVHDSGETGRLFSMLIDENYSGEANSAIICESLINCILIKTERLFSGVKKERPNLHRSEDFVGQPLYDIIRFIDKTTPNCPPVSEICNMFNYSESYISHLFKNRLGTGIREYIIDSRLKYAQMLLSEGKQTVSEIAHMLGYSSSQSFCKSFSKKYGCSPSSYRQTVNNGKKADQDTHLDKAEYCINQLMQL